MNYYLLKAIIVFQNYRVSRAHKKNSLKYDYKRSEAQWVIKEKHKNI